ncbi:hypothetical protein GCM10009839_28230 [Catenulispora yoronensis]|uniref:Zinc-finger domain-containing protein n=1 Tax=Catenulispora yoronensis TaxID=450799 RepID=A0ABP5FIY7_9ACTN
MVIDPAASGPDTHLDPDRMADLYDGLLGPDETDAAQRHLASCDQCAEDFALLTMDSVSGLAEFLAPEPTPIPAEVAIRIEAALHREPPLTPQATGSAEPHHSAAPRRSRRFRLVFGSLAGASLVVAGAFAGIAALNAGGSGSSTAKSSTVTSLADGADSANRAPAGQSPAAGGAAPNAVAPRPSTPSSASAPGLAPGGTPPGGEIDAPPSVATGPDIDQQAQQLLGRIRQNQAVGSGSSGMKTDTASFQCPPPGFGGTTPLGMASITYAGQAAELLVYPKPGDPAHAAVYVVATASCTAPGPGTVLYTSEISRP